LLSGFLEPQLFLHSLFLSKEEEALMALAVLLLFYLLSFSFHGGNTFSIYTFIYFLFHFCYFNAYVIRRIWYYLISLAVDKFVFRRNDEYD
jgi:hypothetical protein